MLDLARDIGVALVVAAAAVLDSAAALPRAKKTAVGAEAATDTAAAPAIWPELLLPPRVLGMQLINTRNIGKRTKRETGRDMTAMDRVFLSNHSAPGHTRLRLEPVR